MKKTLYTIAGILLLSGVSACNEWLDVNDNPSSASSTVPTPDLRLRGIQMNFIDAYESAGTRASWITQNVTKTTGTAYNDYIVKWDVQLASTTWPYQVWFIYAAGNLEPLIEKATSEEAWHYVGAAHLLHAWGFMLMLDLYGEMPYTEALGSIITPKFDDGKTIFEGCMAKLELAIEFLSRPQPPTATPLSGGDLWNGGDANKWIKLAYGLKARWLNNLSKKSIYDPQAILAALEKAAQSNGDNTVMRFINTASTDIATAVRSLQHGNVGGTTTRTSKWYMDILTNTFTGGSGVLDPRTNRLVPSGEFYNAATGKKEWRLTVPVDLITSNIRTQSGPVTYEIMATKYDPSSPNPQKYSRATTVAQRGDSATYKNRWFTTNNTPARQGDSIYVSSYSELLSWVPYNDDRYFAYQYNGLTEAVLKDEWININSTGAFYIRADAPAHLVCHHEMCFIKAEALLRLGRTDEAVIAYKAGIRAHMGLMNEKLREYPQVMGKQVIPESEISDFLTSEAVAQTGAQLTMAKVMQQKQIAMSFTVQNWNDMRRFNYSVPDPKFGVVYPDFDRPYEFDSASAECYPTTDPNNPRYWIRRIQQCGIERQYNEANWLQSNPEAAARTILSYPVWWDTTD